MRPWIRLDTDNKAIARRKLARLMAHGTFASKSEAVAEATKVETYGELADRVAASREAEGIVDFDNEVSRERTWILPEIGPLTIAGVRPSHIAGIYESARAADKSLATLRHLRSILRSRFAVAVEDEIIATSPVDAVRVPKVKIDRRERAVLTDTELAVYLGWQHPQEHHQLAVLERQTMSALARMFGGLRTGDLHVMQWSGFDLPTKDDEPGFAWGVAPRAKTKRPQKIAIPDALRPILQDWWQRQGKPASGLVFPCLRGKHAGVGAKQGVSHAAAMRRDLQSAFEQYRETNAKLGQETLDGFVPAKDSPRWRELFEKTTETRPTDFHSWRRRFVQVLADIGLTAQAAQ